MASTSKDQLHAQLDALVEAAASGAHEHEGAKVERLKSHAATLHMSIDEIRGSPDTMTVYDEVPGENVPGLSLNANGKSVRERKIVARGPFAGETYDSARHDAAGSAAVAAPAEPEPAA